MRNIIGVLLLLVIMIASGANAYDHTDFTMSIDTRVDFTNDNNDSSINPMLRELSVLHSTDNVEIFAEYDEATGTIIADELAYKFEMFGMNGRLGKIVNPFGFDYLERTANSVFMSAPRQTFYDYGLSFGTNYDILNAEGFINGNNDFTLRGTLNLLNDGFITSVSYTEDELLTTNYGEWAINNKFLYSSLVFNVSLLTEYYPDTGGFWSRSVVSPGVFNIVGIICGYYNTEANNILGVDNYTYTPDAWVYGFYVDVAPNTNVSFEWNSNEDLSPLYARLTTRF